MKIAMTGISGNMGCEALKQTFELPAVEMIRVILRNSKKNKILAKELEKTYGNKIQIIYGSIDNQEICDKLVQNMDYVIHMAAVIPPLSDNSPKQSFICNRNGTIALVNAIKNTNPQPKFIHISTIAIYGNRNEKHPWGRVGDPLLISPFDAYAKDKLFAERYVLEADLDNWAVLRQTAMLHPNLFKDNISDGLMFHTALNSPLEWVTSFDSGRLIKNIIKRDSNNEVPQFWKKIYNIGGGLDGRNTGYDTINEGFAIIGGSIEKFFKPNYFSTRNFHGVWLADGDELNNLFDYQRDTFKGFWKQVAKDHPIFALGKLAPKSLLNLCLFNRLVNDENSPSKWIKNNDTPKVLAYFGHTTINNDILPTKWENVKLLTKGDFGDYEKIKKDKKTNLLAHGYDESKPLNKLTLEELQQAAIFRGGKCLAEEVPENEYVKIKWQCSEGHIFESSIYTILGGGHWCPECTMPDKNFSWRFDYLSTKSPFFAQLWYDSHSKEENYVYYIDDNDRQQIKKDIL